MTMEREQDESPRGKMSAPPAGSRLFGKFRLLANLGAGGMGEVFLALSKSSIAGVHKLIVIKRLRHFAEDEARSEARQMFLNEARLATLLNHPNIVQTNDVGVEDEHMYLTMEYLEGQPLNAIVRTAKTKGKKLADAIMLKIVSDALAGLHYAHELRDYDGTPLSIVHRDLSPHNLFVTYEGVVKVVDFGIAKSAGSSKTEQGIIKGKFAYMAPEQAADERVDRRADVFVMGIVLWELLTGERLVYRRNDVQTVNRLLNDTFAAPSTVKPDIGPELDAIVMKALEKDPSLRYQNARDMREAIEEYLLARSHPVRQEEVGPLINDLFSDERVAMRERVRHCIATSSDDAEMDNLPALTAKGTESTGTPSGSRPQTGQAFHPPFTASGLSVSGMSGAASGTLAATIDGSHAGPSPFGPSSPRRTRLAVAGAVVAIGAIALAIYGASGHSAASPAAGAIGPEKTTSAPEVAPTPSPAVSPATPAPEPIRAATNTAAPPPTATPSLKPTGGHHGGGQGHASPPPPTHPAAAAPAPAPAPSPPPTATPTATAHAREFNTTL